MNWKHLADKAILPTCCFILLVVAADLAIVRAEEGPQLVWQNSWTAPAPANGHAQGVTFADDNLYFSSSYALRRTSAASPDLTAPLAINTHAAEDGTPVHQINGITYTDGYIYAAAPIFYKTTPRFFIKWYDPETLQFVGEKELTWDGEGSCQEGISFYNGSWWSCYFDRPVISRYDANLNFIESIPLPGQLLNVQGIRWRDGYLWTAATKGSIRVYSWSEGKHTFRCVRTYRKSPRQATLQSFTFAPDGQSIYWADFDAKFEYLHRVALP